METGASGSGVAEGSGWVVGPGGAVASGGGEGGVGPQLVRISREQINSIMRLANLFISHLLYAFLNILRASIVTTQKGKLSFLDGYPYYSIPFEVWFILEWVSGGKTLQDIHSLY